MISVVPSKGLPWFNKNKRNILTKLSAHSGHFPLCCSTGIITQVGGRCWGDADASSLTPGRFANVQSERIAKIQSAEFIHEIVRACSQGGMVYWPREMANWFVLSLMYAKTVHGLDDIKPITGYSNYKAANIILLDRFNEDKDKGFRFSYNTQFSCDHIIEFMEASGGKYGLVQVSPAAVGGHGARVRGMIFTGDHEYLTEWHDTHIEKVRKHALIWCEHHRNEQPENIEPADDVAAMF